MPSEMDPASLSYLAKKIVGRLLNPLSLGLIAWGLGLWLSRPGRRRGVRGGRLLMILAWVLLAVLAMPVTGRLLLMGLTPAGGDYADPAALSRAGVKTIVVLGGGLRPGRLSAADRLDGASLTRLLEGMRLWRGLPGSTLILSGGPTLAGQPSEAAAMAELARRLGVPETAMRLEEGSLDTADQARLLAPVLGDRPFALVTHAEHMPRALMLFKARGARPLPAAMGFARRVCYRGARDLIPGPGGLSDSGRAIHEYLGRAFALLKGLLT